MTPDRMTFFKSLSEEIREINARNGFVGTSRESIKDKIVSLALIGTEVAEAIQTVRSNVPDEFLEEEVADIIIRCLDFSAAMGFDIDVAVAKKLEINKGSPYKHGKLI